MAIVPDSERKTVTLPKAYIDVYKEEVKRLRLLGERSSMADLIREAIARDVKRRKRKR